MTPRYTLVTHDRNTYIGAIVGGRLDIDGVSFPAINVRSIEILTALHGGSYDPGEVELLDGSVLKVTQWNTGLLNRERHVSLSGDVVIHSDSLDRDIQVPAIDIRRLFHEWVPGK